MLAGSALHIGAAQQFQDDRHLSFGGPAAPPVLADDSGASSVALRAPSDAPESCFFAFDMHLLLENIFYFKCSQCTVQENSGPGEMKLPYRNIVSMGF